MYKVCNVKVRFKLNRRALVFFHAPKSARVARGSMLDLRLSLSVITLVLEFWPEDRIRTNKGLTTVLQSKVLLLL